MEAVAGPHGDPLSFREIITRNKRIDPAAALNVCFKLANALGFAHSQGVLHLDLKPENILVDHLGHLRIVDFGLAQFSEEKSGKTTIISMRQRSVGNAVFGTPGYMPPERNIAGSKPDARQDIYSLGALLYEMLIGNIPEGRFELPSELAPEMPGALDHLIEKSLNFHPDKRYSSMDEFSEALENALKVVKAGAIKKLAIKKEPPPPPPAKNPVAAIVTEDKKKSKTRPPVAKDPTFTCFIILISFMGLLVIAALAAALFFSFSESPKKTEEPPEPIDEKTSEAPPKQMQTPALLNPPKTNPFTALTQAAEAGDAKAQCKLGEYYLSGKEGLADYTKASVWFEKAAKQNEPRATFLLAELIKKGLVNNSNSMEALKLYMKAAKAGSPEARNKLGEFYFYGDSIAPFRDCKEAFKWFQKAAKQNNSDAIYNLGECYFYGQGTAKDCGEAVKLYKKAAAQGNKRAQYALGKAYEKGLGISKDMNQARKYYSLSAQSGYAPAEEAIQKLKTK
jgi:hypothetical protein